MSQKAALGATSSRRIPTSCRKCNTKSFPAATAKLFQLEKGCQRLLDTLPKPGHHHFAQLVCHSSLKRKLVGGLKYIWIFCLAPSPKLLQLIIQQANASVRSEAFRYRPKIAAASFIIIASFNDTVGSIAVAIDSSSSSSGLAALYLQSFIFLWIFNEVSLIAAYALAVGCY
jgi:hypothetical protein